MRVTWQMAVAEAARCGFSYAAVIPARRLTEYRPNLEAVKQRIGDDPFAVLAEARSVLVAAMPFAWHSPWPRDCAEVSAFYFQSQQAHVRIRTLSERLVSLGAQAANQQDLPAKPLARDAGVGVIGRNSLIRNRKWGSSVTIRVLVTDIEPQDSLAPLAAPSCGKCRRCVDSCPTGALLGDGQLDTRRCLRAHMMTGEVIPETLRAPMGLRLLGCEICQRVCPHNAGMTSIEAETTTFAIDTLLHGARRDLDIIAAQIGWNEARLQRVQAQAAIVAGNSGDARYLPLLHTLWDHEREAVREHARWAIRRIEEGNDVIS